MLIAQLEQSLLKRSQLGLQRNLDLPPAGLIDFTSNDYLGLSRNPEVHALVDECTVKLNSACLQDLGLPDRAPDTGLGSTGSRLLSGNSACALSLEAFLAKFHKAPSALLFNSGYDANLSLFSTVPQVGSSILYDELVHASVHDGMKTARTKHKRAFAHNDVGDLKGVLMEEVERIETDPAFKGKPGPGIIVAVESIYSMDGDIAPLVEIVETLESLGDRAGGAYLIVDEAHSTGLCGKDGSGLVVELNLQDRIFARLHTFGKAVGAHGSVVVGPKVLREYLVNYARPLIYSTCLPYHSLVSIRCSYAIMENRAVELQEKLKGLIDRFRTSLLKRLPAGISLIPSQSPIQGIIIPGNVAVTEAAKSLRALGFDARPIRSPTVPKGSERLRICLHAHNTLAEIESFAECVGTVLGKKVEPRAVAKL
ncbi:hypothetical protein HDU76_013463 [Blyttiomyces sp. JEL0837]|nr:hypothetical protein HDU76_013463 [Blyttiomyces sp. JEL0837]